MSQDPTSQDLFERFDTSRLRVAWWLIVAALGAFVLSVLYAFVGTVTLGLFLYYASRPAYRRVRRHVDSSGLAAMVTLFGATAPIVVVLSYAAITVATDVVASTGLGPEDAVAMLGRRLFGGDLSGSGQAAVATLLEDPARLRSIDPAFVTGLVDQGLQTVGTIGAVLVHLGLAFALAFTLLHEGDDFADWLLTEVAGGDETTTAFWRSVDRNLQTVYFGNVLLIAAVGLVAAVVYHGFNLLAPAPLTIPMPTLLALLTGVATLVPLLVGKIVYLPIVGYVALRAAQLESVGATPPLALLVVSFLILDIVPQTFLRPYLGGREIGTELMMFAYVLGPLLFGWYGIFLLPLMLVLVIQTARIVLVELIHGRRLTTATSAPMPGDPARTATSTGRDGPERRPNRDGPAAADGEEAGDAPTDDVDGGDAGEGTAVQAGDTAGAENGADGADEAGPSVGTDGE